MTTHDIKCLPWFFAPLATGEKTFEIRKDDRGYKVGDGLRIREWSMASGYTGQEMWFSVTYIYRGKMLDPNYVVLAIRPVTGDAP